MPEGRLVFVDIDTQRDFLEPAGALSIPGSDAIIANLGRLTQFALGHQIPILATACCHEPDDPELKRFPAHCMRGSTGEKRLAATDVAGSVVLAVGERLTGEIPLHLTVQKREIDVFTRPDFAELIARYNQARPTFVVYGVATDYCVSAAVIGLLNAGCRVAIVADAIRAIDVAMEPAVLTELVNRGALLTITDVICRLRER
ncbi:MAG: cysteine hydrolase family protein [Isosphaeraceae bacterium]